MTLNGYERDVIMETAKMLSMGDRRFTQFEFFETLKQQYMNDELTHDQLESMGLSHFALLSAREKKIFNQESPVQSGRLGKHF